MAEGKTPHRTIRMGDLWLESQAHAADAGVTMTDYVTVALERLNADPDRALLFPKGGEGS